MARRQRSTQVPRTLEDADQAASAAFQAIAGVVQEDVGSNAAIGQAADSGLVGLPLPALSLRYLFAGDAFLLSRTTQIVGEEGTCKSALLSEILRWHIMYGGYGAIFENEGKDAPAVRHGILHWHPAYVNRVGLYPTYDLEGWQDLMTSYGRAAAAYQLAAPENSRPFMMGLDSIMGTASRDTIAAIEKAGHASRSFALEALLISQYMRTMPQRLRYYPFSVVGTNHMKPAVDQMGRPKANVPGGKAVKFYETYEIEMRFAPTGHDIDRQDHQGLRLQLRARKNSAGPSRRSLIAEFLWWYEADPAGDPTKRRQLFSWDWDTATIELFLSFENAKGKKTLYNNLVDITGIRVPSRTTRSAYSDKLDIPKSDPQHYRVVAQRLEQRPDLLLQLYDVLGINRFTPFQSGMVYRDLVQEAAAKSLAAAAAIGRATNEAAGQASEDQFSNDEGEA